MSVSLFVKFKVIELLTQLKKVIKSKNPVTFIYTLKHPKPALSMQRMEDKKKKRGEKQKREEQNEEIQAGAELCPAKHSLN